VEEEEEEEEGQRPPAVREIREGGYSEEHAPPWALHTPETRMDARVFA